MSKSNKINRWFDESYQVLTDFSPQSVDGVNNSSYFYYWNKLLKMVKHIFEWKGLPPEWDRNYFLDKLYLNGLLVVFDSKVGIIPLECSTYGINVFGYPTNWRVSNVILGGIEGTIGKDGELLYIDKRQGTFGNLRELLSRYSTMLAEVDGSIESALINSRTAHIFMCENDGTLKTWQKAYDEITTGKPALFIQKSDFDANSEHYLFNNVKQMYVGNDLYATKKSIMNDFLTEIGVNNVQYEKKERLISDEVNVNQIELASNIWQWKQCIDECLDKINDRFNLSISIEQNGFGYDEKELFSQEETHEQIKQQED